MAMTDKQQQRLENLEQMAAMLAHVVAQMVPPEIAGPLRAEQQKFLECCQALGSEAPQNPGDIRPAPRAFRPELILPGG